ncbi:MAG: hypothetical protein QOF75_2542, partial [Gaiellaceae bacterium]|nr:hypothetical protein [Gaiellaceae bacterium]
FRASAATEQSIPGSGLGLSISQAIAEAHGGTISLSSEPGVGTTFRIEAPLPRANTDVAPHITAMTAA